MPTTNQVDIADAIWGGSFAPAGSAVSVDLRGGVTHFRGPASMPVNDSRQSVTGSRYDNRDN